MKSEKLDKLRLAAAMVGLHDPAAGLAVEFPGAKTAAAPAGKGSEPAKAAAAAAVPPVLGAAASVGQLLSYGEVASRLGVSDRTVRRMADAGEFPRPVKVRGRRLFVLAEVEAWLVRSAANRVS